MKFTLLFYTDGWESGPTVELAHIPTPGTIVWAGGRRRGEDGAMYYVDNVMYPEAGLEREDVVYLYVRPYTGYAKYAPMTEADRLAEKLIAVREELSKINGKLDTLIAGNSSLKEEFECLRELTARTGNNASSVGGQLVQFADSIEDGQQSYTEKLDDIVVILEQIKEQL